MDLHVCHACALMVRSYLQLTLTPPVVQAQYLPPLNDITTSTEATVARAQLRKHMLQCRVLKKPQETTQGLAAQVIHMKCFLYVFNASIAIAHENG